MGAVSRPSGWIAVVALLICLAPGSSGQSSRSSRTSHGLAGSVPWVAAVPAGLTLQRTSLALISEPLLSDAKKKKKGGGGGGVEMPEGGSPFTYLGLAAFVCLGAVFLHQRQKRNSERSTGS